MCDRACVSSNEEGSYKLTSQLSGNLNGAVTAKIVCLPLM